MAKKKKTLEELLRWAKRKQLTISFWNTQVEILHVRSLHTESVIEKTLLSALRAAYREWGSK